MTEPDDVRVSESEPSTTRNKGKGKSAVVGPGSDDDALWAQFPGSQITDPIPTQQSFHFSNDGSHNTSMTSVSSSNSGKRKRGTELEPLPPLIEEITKAMLDPSEKREIPSIQSTSESLPEMVLEEPVAGPSRVSSPGGNIYIVAHDRRVQGLMDSFNISWGTQYEIARGISDGRWEWSEITVEKLKQLKGKSQDAASRVSSVLMDTSDSAQHGTHRDIWEELDREQEAIIENENRGLGLQGEWHGKTSWYGGRIQQIAKMELVQATNSYAVRLEKMQMIRSHRFARFLGSRRLLQMKHSGDRRDIALEQTFLMQRFVLCGRVFVPFSTKDGKVYLVETTENYERMGTDAQGDQYRLALEEFVEWHNPLALNRKQPVAKWATRFDLGLSTSVPVLKIAPENIIMMKDIYAKHLGPKIATEMNFTDGCGWINRAALVVIAENLGVAEVPTAVQGRIFGAKGVWMLHPHDHAVNTKPRIWIRASQQKIKLVKSESLELSELKDLHPAHLIFDLVAPSIVTVKTRLNRLTLVNLAHNGVPCDVFVNLMKENLSRELKPLTRWDGPHAMQLLSHHVDRSTGASSTRLQQFISGAQRALGQSRKREAGDTPDDDHGTLLGKALASGRPLSIPEEVLHLIRAGFKPMEELYLYEQLKMVVSWVVTETVKNFHTPIPDSADAFIVPDPFGVLKEGEIHFSSSRVLQESLHCLHPKTIVGDVLLYRNPARLPSDIRKVKAVDCEALRRYTDVIILPIAGFRSMASLLAGGDVDGDVAVCIWDRDIVNAFVNSPINSMPEDTVEKYFEPESAIELVSTVYDEVQSRPDRAQSIIQRRLLSGLTESKVGIYSKYHENAIYALGYDHPETLRIAYMFNILLDSRKTGHVVKPAAFQRDTREYCRDSPPCLVESDRELATDHNPNYIRRASHLPKFILEELIAAGKKVKDEYLQLYEAQRPPVRTQGLDEQVLAPYKRCGELAAFAEELQIVKTFVGRFCTRFRDIWSASPQKMTAALATVKKRQARQQEALRSLVTDAWQHHTHTVFPQSLRTPWRLGISCLSKLQRTKFPRFWKRWLPL
ncbi:RNA dependent RNA polymerase-domain-containing protein [Irpex rosettiformis]|uniref:RNA dependent RNA polymerase-domain-containing protein n=1 Tax=Irpex rosettiformis TaxID=378272 RepID=A0ACB8UKT2_9APHY|nr:RNA dependent RNA polymerase-domain-containing protein [Irpex rosettiformis]